MQVFNDVVKEVLYDYDKLWIKYAPEWFAYKYMKSAFIGMKQYTHLVILPEDLIVHRKGVEKLFGMAQINFNTVCCGVCNVDCKDLKDFYNITFDLPPIAERVWRNYHWVHNSLCKGEMLKVAFAGCPFFIIPRYTAERLSFGVDWKQHSSDLVMCYELDAMRIPIYAYTDCTFNHLRYAGTVRHEPNATIKLEKKTGEIIEYK